MESDSDFMQVVLTLPSGGVGAFVGEDAKKQFAIIAQRLFSEHATSVFVTQLLESASPEVKKQLADALLQNVIEKITTGVTDSGSSNYNYVSGRIEGAVSNHVAALAESILKKMCEESDDLHFKIKEKIVDQIPKMINTVCSSVVEKCKSKFVASLSDALKLSRYG